MWCVSVCVQCMYVSVVCVCECVFWCECVWVFVVCFLPGFGVCGVSIFVVWFVCGVCMCVVVCMRV